MEEEVKSATVKTSEQIDEKPWVFLEKELQEFEKVMKQLEEGEFRSNRAYASLFVLGTLYDFLK